MQQASWGGDRLLPVAFGQGVVMLVALLLGACGQRAGGPDMPDMGVILAEEPAALLRDYGLFTDASAQNPAEGVIGYDLINPLFSDHARKDRYVFVPGGQAANWTADDVFDFPVGSVLVKSFSYPETGVIETRVLIHKADGWRGYPYVWNADHSQAIYTPIGAKKQIETADYDGVIQQITYAVPNQNQCKTCHQAGDSVVPIGPKARNLGLKQVQNWQNTGILSGAPVSFQSTPSITKEEGDLAARARAYLDINCGHCHKADGAASNSGLWLAWTEDSLVKLGIGKHPTAAGRGAGKLIRVIEPGAPAASILAYRMASVEPGVAMPELGRTLIDEEGVALVNEWILEMQND